MVETIFKLIFLGVSKIIFDKNCEDKQEEFKLDNLRGSHILSAEEIPMIEYIFNCKYKGKFIN